MDFSGAPTAAEHAAQFLDAAMTADINFSAAAPPERTDVGAVRDALQRLRDEQNLTADDHERLLSVLQESQ
jgi:hypothetical protein